jgi:chaperonin cofactor prefoldin
MPNLEIKSIIEELKKYSNSSQIIKRIIGNLLKEKVKDEVQTYLDILLEIHGDLSDKLKECLLGL